MKKANWRRGVATAAALTAGLTGALAASAQAADITVSSIESEGAGTLRDAIDTANETPSTTDRIIFQPGLSGTIALDANLPSISGPLDVVGPGRDRLTVDGGGLRAIFQSAADLSISGLTIANGRASVGAGVAVNPGDLTIEDSRITGGISSGAGGGLAVGEGHLTLTDTEVTGNKALVAGGVGAQQASVTITGSTISGNESTSGDPMSRGGGVVLELREGTKSSMKDSVVSGNTAGMISGMQVGGGDMTIDSSLISGNISSGQGPALMLGEQMLTDLDKTSVTLVNSTVADNQAAQNGAGIVSIGGKNRIESTTITDNRIVTPGIPFANGAGLIQAGGVVALNNSILSDNTPVDVSTIPANSVPPVPQGEVAGSFNLVGDHTYAVFSETVAGSNVESTNPQLGDLADNGGPTKTMLPADTSPAVNKGSSSLKVDQRGLARPVDFAAVPFSSAVGANGADIGAVELQYDAPPPPPPPSNRFGFGWTKLNKKKGVASLQVNVPGAGKVLVVGSKTVAKFSKDAKKAGTVTVTLKAKGKAAKQLKKKGSVKIKASVRFTPTGGSANTKPKSVKLVKKKPKKKKAKR